MDCNFANYLPVLDTQFVRLFRMFVNKFLFCFAHGIWYKDRWENMLYVSIAALLPAISASLALHCIVHVLYFLSCILLLYNCILCSFLIFSLLIIIIILFIIDITLNHNELSRRTAMILPILSRRTATTRYQVYSPEGCQKRTAPRCC